MHITLLPYVYVRTCVCLFISSAQDGCVILHFKHWDHLIVHDINLWLSLGHCRHNEKWWHNGQRGTGLYELGRISVTRWSV